MKTYAFLYNDKDEKNRLQQYRVEVIASTPRSGYNKLMSIPHLSDKIVPMYMRFGKDGFQDTDWTSLRKTKNAR
tara:strand:- start:6419 stop:6640 length:222 start_codon:yes stop_codon:yes gene_type:complete